MILSQCDSASLLTFLHITWSFLPRKPLAVLNTTFYSVALNLECLEDIHQPYHLKEKAKINSEILTVKAEKKLLKNKYNIIRRKSELTRKYVRCK